MREHKYKAWNKDHNFMGLVYEIDFRYGIVKIETDEGTTHTFGITKVELLQFTGLHDKNGSPVYESDIVRYVRECEKVASVSYNEDIAAFLFGEDEIGDNITDIEVIGNIYQHPELINRR